MLLYLVSSDSEKKRIDKALEQCKVPFSEQILPIYQIAKLPFNLRHKQVQSLMNSLSMSERQTISIILSKKKAVENQKAQVKLFNSFVESLHQEMSKGSEFRLRERVQKLVVKKHKHSVLGYLLEILLALNIDNQAWAKSALSDLLHKDLARIAFNIDKSYFSGRKEQKRFKENLRSAILYIAEKLEHKMLGSLAINYFSVFDVTDATNRLLQNIGSPWSLSQVRAFADKKVYGQDFFIPWYYILKEKAIELELESYVEKFLTPQMIRKLGADVIPIFSTHFPKGKEKRKAFFDVLIRSFEYSDYYTRFVLIHALKSDAIRKGISKELPKNYMGASFQLERNFYHDALVDGGLTNLAVFKLTELGEENIKLLWWLVL